MDASNLVSSAQQIRKSAKKPKKTSCKKKPVKVVYISNPMMVKTSAADFRALVQELTGQDAEFPDPTKFPAADIMDVGGRQVPTAADSRKMMMVRDDDEEDHEAAEADEAAATMETSSSQEQPESSGSTALYEPFDDAFVPQMMENFSGEFSAGLLYDSLE